MTASPIPGGPKRLEWSPDSNSILATEQNDAAVWLFDASGRHAGADDPRRQLRLRPPVPPAGRRRAAHRPCPRRYAFRSSPYDLATGHETMLAADLAWLTIPAPPAGRPTARRSSTTRRRRTNPTRRGCSSSAPTAAGPGSSPPTGIWIDIRPSMVAGRHADRLHPV